MGRSKAAGCTRDAGAGVRLEQLERADRCEHNRQAQLAAEHIHRTVHFGDIAQYPRTESNFVQRHAVPTHRGFRLGGPDDVVPLILVQVRARLADELVKILELFATRTEFNGRWWDASCLVHGVLPGSWAAQPLPFRYRVRWFSTRHGASGRGDHYLGLPLGRCGRARISSSEPTRLPRPGPVRSRTRKPAMSEMLLFSPLAIRSIAQSDSRAADASILRGKGISDGL